MKKKIQLAIATMLIFYASSVKILAQECDCGAALAKDRIEHSKEDFEQLYYLNQLKKNEYEELKKSYNGEFKYKKLLKGSVDYSDFRKKITSEIQKIESEEHRQYKSSYYESRTSPIAYQEWSKCMELQCGKGLFLWISDEDENTIILKLKYNPPPNSSKINYTVTIDHADNSTENRKGFIGLNETQSIHIKRRCGSIKDQAKTFISINGGGYSSDKTSKYYCGKLRTKIITLSENQNCTDEDCLDIKNIEKVEILNFVLEQRVNDRTDCKGPESLKDQVFSSLSDIEKLNFGFWENPQCRDAIQGKWKGTGWHFSTGSCCREPIINGFTAVTKVKARVTYFE